MIHHRSLILLGLLGLTACASKPPENAATLSLHLPASAALPSSRRIPIEIPTPTLSLVIDSWPVLTEKDLQKAEILGEGESFLMRFTFDTHGTIELDRVSNNNRDELLIVLINGIPVAAPKLRERIMDGFFAFTPNLTREQGEKVVEGLNSMVEYLNKK